MERWLTFSSYCKKKYGHRLYRVPLDGGFTCPNRDGTKGSGGCIFCSGQGSGEFAIRYEGQRLQEEDFLYNRTRGHAGEYLGYFQAFTGTYGPLEKLRKLYVSVLDNPLFAGIDIGTRPDCLGEDVISLLKELREAYPDRIFYVELGLQTMHEETAFRIRRGYPLSVFEEAVERLRGIGIDVIVHVILGLMDEDEKMETETIRYLSAQDIQGVKISSLQYLKGTDLGRMLEEGKDMHVLSEAEYIHACAVCLGWLREDIVIHRLTGDGNSPDLIAPLWAEKKGHVINAIRHEMKEMDLYQGKYWKEKAE